VEVFLEAYPEAPKEIILDLDATTIRCTGNQEGRFFHGYYGNYCYLPLYIFCGEFLLCARLRSIDIDAAAGAWKSYSASWHRFVPAWPQVRMMVRGTPDFCREELMAWCEANRVEYLLGLAEKRASEGRRSRQEMGEGESTVPTDRTRRRLFKEFVYPDHGRVGAVRGRGGGQGRASGERREPAIRW